MTSTFFWLPATYRGAVVLAILSLPLLIGCSDSKQPITAESSDFKAEDRVDQADSAPAPSAEGSGSGSGDPGSRDPGSREPASGSAAGPEGRGKREPDRAGGVEAGVGDGGPPVQPPSRSQRQLDSLEVPEGPPEQLLAFIQQVENWQPPAGMSQKEAFETMQTIMGAQIEAAERILAHPQATDPQRRTAFDVKLSVLNNLHLLGVQESRDHLVEFVEAIQSDRDPEMARAGRLMSFNFRLEESVRQEVDDPQMASLVKELKTLLDEEPHTSQVLNFLGTAALEMLRAGYSEQGREAIDAIVKAFQDAEPAVAEASQGLLEQAKIHQVGFDQKRSAFVQSKPESMRPLLDAVNTLLTGENAGPTTLTLAFQVADDLERAQEFEAARNLYDAIEAEFSDVENEEVRMFARQTVQNARKRLGLLNEPLALEGTKLDGSPLDWSKYEGEVVLVNFWSTQDANSIRELSNIIELREKYQNKDFAVIGVNMDQDQESVERFFALQSPLPWVTVVDAASGEDQLAERVGVGMLPFSLLLDREGKVAALHVSGPKLQEHVEKLLGPPAAKPDGARSELPRSDETFFVALFDDEETETADVIDEDSNPYLADKDLDAGELLDFLFEMEDKPSSIQSRPGFAAAVANAADRLLDTDAPEKHKLIAVESKLKFLHQAAVDGDQKADQQLVEFARTLRKDPREKVARQARFLLLERQVLDADELKLDEIPELLEQLKKFYETNELDNRHVRMASATIRAINRLEDGDQREKHFATFGSLFAKSDDKELARYGAKIAKTSPSTGAGTPDLVGKTLELNGVTALGTDFDWKRYRGKVVIVDFWATWCGPCVKEMPHLKAAFEKHHEDGLDVVAVNLDKGEKGAVDLARFIEQHGIPWTNIVEPDAQKIARKYGVRAIPTMLLVDREGHVVASAHKLDDISEKLAELLAEKE